jgi:hypothetical protein
VTGLRATARALRGSRLGVVLVAGLLVAVLAGCGSSKPGPSASAPSTAKPSSAAAPHNAKKGVSLDCQTCGGGGPEPSTAASDPGGIIHATTTGYSVSATDPPTDEILGSVVVESTGKTPLVITSVTDAPSGSISSWQFLGACAPSSSQAVELASGASCTGKLSYEFPATSTAINMTLNFATNAGTLSATVDDTIP